MPTTYRRRPRWVFVLLACVVLFGATAGGRNDLERSPYGSVASDLLRRLHATPVACELVVDADTVCFGIAPGTVAGVAEMLESLIAEYGGALVRSEWRSGNGVHHVEVRLSDDLWGALEVWLTEPDGRTVSGRLLYQPKHRSGSP